MPLISMQEALLVEDPANAWTWTATITLPEIFSSGGDIGGQSVGYGSNLISQVLSRVYVQAIMLPFTNIELRPRYRGGSHMNFPGTTNIGACNLTLYETADFKILRHMLSWQSYITTKNISATTIGSYGLPKDYTGKIDLEYFDGMGNKVLTATLSCWPHAIGDWALDYHNISNLTINATFAVNNIDYKFGDNYSIITPHNSYHGAPIGAFPTPPSLPQPPPNTYQPPVFGGT